MDQRQWRAYSSSSAMDQQQRRWKSGSNDGNCQILPLRQRTQITGEWLVRVCCLFFPNDNDRDLKAGLLLGAQQWLAPTASQNSSSGWLRQLARKEEIYSTLTRYCGCEEDWNKGRVKMRFDLKRGHCFFFVALLGVLFGCGTLSVAAISQCNGSIAQCYYQQESMMESEISGRLLAAVPNNYPAVSQGVSSSQSALNDDFSKIGVKEGERGNVCVRERQRHSPTGHKTQKSVVVVCFLARADKTSTELVVLPAGKWQDTNS
ncbi:hypothetical protein MRB53_005543 [Persea americana]|uniref:Uncharacterized protein n=1 Tax=Persea americana TaxID=3435 RepID=A0ACC2MDM2_PERAE|nr:hypothetical protein MRB53_005543 [Persea americana]